MKKLSKLQNTINKNHKKNTEFDAKKFKAACNYLRQFVPEAFSLDFDKIKALMTGVEKENPQSNNDYSKDNLLLHINDKRWLARYLLQVITTTNQTIKENEAHIAEINELVNAQYQVCGVKTDENITDEPVYKFKQPKINLNTIRLFVEGDAMVRKELNRIKYDMVGVEIDLMLENDEPKLTKEQRRNADRYFYQYGYKKLSSIYHLDHQDIAIGFEKNAKWWQDKKMQEAYLNTYDYSGKITDQQTWLKTNVERKSHEKDWIQQRKLQHYKTLPNTVRAAFSTSHYPKLNAKQEAALNQKLNAWDQKFKTLTAGNGKNDDDKIM